MHKLKIPQPEMAATTGETYIHVFCDEEKIFINFPALFITSAMPRKEFTTIRIDSYHCVY